MSHPTPQVGAGVERGPADGTVTVLAFLMFLWGAVSLPLAPRAPFGVVNALQTIGFGAAVVYCLATRHRRSRRFDIAFKAGAFVYALILLPWTAVAWTSIGRPIEAFTVPQIAALATALVVPRPRWLALTLIALFVGEGLFAVAIAQAHGLAELVPRGEPLITMIFGVFGLGLVTVCERRRRLMLRYMQAQTEVIALRGAGPLLDHIRRDLATHLGAIARALYGGMPAPGTTRSRAPERSLVRLESIGGDLDRLTEAQLSRDDPHAERAFLAQDAHIGATAFAVLVTVLSFLVVLAGSPPPTGFLATGALGVVSLGYLALTRRHRSERRASAVVVALTGALMLASFSMQDTALAMNRPFIAFLGPKVLMVLVGLIVTSRAAVCVLLIGVTALAAFVEFYALGMGARRDVISMFEPWVVLVYAAIAVAALLLRDERRVAWNRLRHAELEAEALERRALLVLATRDRLNSALQTLTLGEEQLIAPLSPQAAAEVHAGVAGLTAVSRRLAALDNLVPPRLQRTSFDADEELRPRL